MNILIDLVNYPMVGFTEDHRYTILRGLGDTLRSRGHQIYAPEIPYRLLAESGYRPYNEFSFLDVEFFISRSPYGPSPNTSRFEFHRSRGTPGVAYEHGWLPGTMVMDRRKLFGDSHYYESIGGLLEDYGSGTEAEELRQSLIARDLSKRTQQRIDPIPCEDFIFIPGQAIHDCSIVMYSDIGLLDFIRTTLEVASENGLQVVYKPHPGLEAGNPAHGKELLAAATEELQRAHQNFHIVNTSIYDLTRAARFTACINSGSMIDNVVTQSPVYCCGRSLFSLSGAVIYDPDVRRGLATMIARDYDAERMRLRQAKLLWWLHRHLLREDVGPYENLRRLEVLSGVKF